MAIDCDHIRIIQGDICRARVDAIINAANSRMLGGGGVDGAIHRAAGPALMQACLQVPVVNGIRCPVGEAKITAAGYLFARFVIHTVGPIYDSDPSPAQHLASAYRNALRLALEHGCQSVALPAISCGAYGYPHREAAEIAVRVCCEPAFKGLAIHCYLLNETMASLWDAVKRALCAGDY